MLTEANLQHLGSSLYLSAANETLQVRFAQSDTSVVSRQSVLQETRHGVLRESLAPREVCQFDQHRDAGDDATQALD
jgi:hypothetical protein